MIAKAPIAPRILINQLLMLARAEASHDKVHRVEPVDLEALTRAVTQDWVLRAVDKRIDLGFEGSDRPLMIDGSAVAAARTGVEPDRQRHQVHPERRPRDGTHPGRGVRRAGSRG